MGKLKLENKLQLYKITLANLAKFDEIAKKYGGFTYTEKKEGVYVNINSTYTADRVRAILALYGIPFLENENGIYIGKKETKSKKKGRK